MLRLIFPCIVFSVVDLALLLALANQVSWKAALLEVLVSGTLGVAVIRYVGSQFGRRLMMRLAVSESPGEAVADGAILFLAGALLVLPGIISDAAGLLLLLPPVRRLVVMWLKRRYAPRAGTFDVQFARWDTVDNPSADEIIIDGRIEDGRELTDD